MNYKQARIFCFAAIAILVVLTVGGLVRCSRGGSDGQAINPKVSAVEKKVKDKLKIQKKEPIHIDRRVGNLAKQLNDLNPEHLYFAQSIGIKPIEETRDILKLQRPLVKVEGNKYYTLDELTHSYAFLVPEAAALLDTIGVRFHRKLAERGGGDYQLKVTSLLRTQESVKRLRRGNVNSTQNSAHLYATTFDISYVDFPEGLLNPRRIDEGSLKNLLGEVLLELRDEDRCRVKFERKQPCFHITATGR